ncbi:MAG: aminotransferase class I/II-fold pyridoxal phosphate-dependent enzyme [Cyanobacteria bacterium P01_D01_bin.105]
MPLDQSQTPLVDALKTCANKANAAFYTPGHKRGQGISNRHNELFGSAIFHTDLPELPELDNLFAPEGVILQAQRLAAEAFGADQTWFLANGSTCGIQAAILATCNPGDKIILPRNVHASAIAGLILSGARPIYQNPHYSSKWNIPTALDPSSIAVALTEHPDAKAVLVISPTYQGICSDLKAIADHAHAHNIPLIVDEAHGPHFAFHPQLPPSALSAGADIVVQSTHKVLSAFTQSAMLHRQGNRVDSNRINQCLQLTQSTSPSYLLLGSLDAARYQMATAGEMLMAKTLELADIAYTELSKLSGLSLLQLKNSDRTRLTVGVWELGLTGFSADAILHKRFGVTAELPSLHHLTFIISLGNTRSDIDHLIKGFQELASQNPTSQNPASQNPASQKRSRLSEKSGSSQAHSMKAHSMKTNSIKPFLPLPFPALSSRSPRDAFYSKTYPTPTTHAVGHICAEIICPYPPGIPALLPGETITAEAIAHLQTLLNAGAIITGAQDTTLQTILTVAEDCG